VIYSGTLVPDDPTKLCGGGLGENLVLGDMINKCL